MTIRNPRTDPPTGGALTALDVRGPALASGLGRLAIGAGLAVAPGRALAALGFAQPSAASIAVARLAGGRDIVLGALTLGAMGDRERLRTATLATAAVDAGDAAIFIAGLRSGEQELREASIRGIAASSLAVLGAVWVAVRLGSGALSRG